MISHTFTNSTLSAEQLFFFSVVFLSQLNCCHQMAWCGDDLFEQIVSCCPGESSTRVGLFAGSALKGAPEAASLEGGEDVEAQHVSGRFVPQILDR